MPLASELDALCGSNANPILAKRQETGSKPQASLTKKEKRPSKDGLFSLAAELGFEPRHTESESAVLPLHNSAKCYFIILNQRLTILTQKIPFVNTFLIKIVCFSFSPFSKHYAKLSNICKN